MRKSDSYVIALGGILTAVSITIMFMGSMIPFATFAVPAMASLTVLFFVMELSKTTAFIVYLSISILSLLLVSDREVTFLFAFFFGHYPILKALFENLKRKILEYLLKFSVFNISIISAYFLMLKIFGFEAIVKEFADYKTAFLLLLLVLGNVTFFVYDIALTRLIILYIRLIRPKLKRR
ncbi:MAG: hypothetical protein GX222_04150 [Ruminococcaceae bacterium]|nr:hypothetical protein [Oscillospiraceae bacterium]